jgi:hypothetical protein
MKRNTCEPGRQLDSETDRWSDGWKNMRSIDRQTCTHRSAADGRVISGHRLAVSGYVDNWSRQTDKWAVSRIGGRWIVSKRYLDRQACTSSSASDGQTTHQVRQAVSGQVDKRAR